MRAQVTRRNQFNFEFSGRDRPWFVQYPNNNNIFSKIHHSIFFLKAIFLTENVWMDNNQKNGLEIQIMPSVIFGFWLNFSEKWLTFVKTSTDLESHVFDKNNWSEKKFLDCFVALHLCMVILAFPPLSTEWILLFSAGAKHLNIFLMDTFRPNKSLNAFVHLVSFLFWDHFL